MYINRSTQSSFHIDDVHLVKSFKLLVSIHIFVCFPTLWLSQSLTLLRFPALAPVYSSLLSDQALPYSQPHLKHYGTNIIHFFQYILQTLPLAMVFLLTNYDKFYSHELRSRCREIEQHEDMHEDRCDMAGYGTNHGRVFCYQVLQNCLCHDNIHVSCIFGAFTSLIQLVFFQPKISTNTTIVLAKLDFWSEQSACAALGCRQKRRWPL